MDADLLAETFRTHDVAVAYLFGSRAVGAHTSTSDHDIAVLFSSDQLPIDATARLAAALGKVMDTDVDVVDLERASIELRGTVAIHGKLLFSSDEPRRVRFEGQARNAWFDFRPVLEATTAGYLQRVAHEGFGDGGS